MNIKQIGKHIYQLLTIVFPILLGYFLINYWQISEEKRKKEAHLAELEYELTMRKGMLQNIIADGKIIYSSGDSAEIEIAKYEAAIHGSDRSPVVLRKFKSYSLKELILEFSLEINSQDKDRIYQQLELVDFISQYKTPNKHIEPVIKRTITYTVDMGKKGETTENQKEVKYDRLFYKVYGFEDKIKIIFNKF
ncbi:MAG TPA: hypothetical protein PLY62_08505 [Bacteroidales bacterium]|nr:hypothetical protein [Bacteroidales bacterium]